MVRIQFSVETGNEILYLVFCTFYVLSVDGLSCSTPSDSCRKVERWNYLILKIVVH